MRSKLIIYIYVLFFSYNCQASANPVVISKLNKIGHMIGKQDGIIITDWNDKILFAKNEDSLLIPASTLKIFTSLMVLDYLGQNHKFITDFYLDDNFNLKIKGYGDPLLISEVLKTIAENLSNKLIFYNKHKTHVKQTINK